MQSNVKMINLPYKVGFMNEVCILNSQMNSKDVLNQVTKSWNNAVKNNQLHIHVNVFGYENSQN